MSTPKLPNTHQLAQIAAGLFSRSPYSSPDQLAKKALELWMACACVLNPKKPLQNKISDSSKVIKITKEDGEEAFRTLEKITQNNDYKYKTPMGLTAAIYKHRAKSPARKRVLEMIEAKPNQVDTSEAELTKLVEKRKDNDSRKRRERNAKSK